MRTAAGVRKEHHGECGAGVLDRGLVRDANFTKSWAVFGGVMVGGQGGLYRGLHRGLRALGVIWGDTRSLDYSSAG